MSAVDFPGAARALDGLADALEADASLNPDEALRKAVWGDPHTPYPSDDAPGADAFEEAHSAMEAKTGFQGAGIDGVPRAVAIAAAREEAARYRSYGGGR